MLLGSVGFCASLHLELSEGTYSGESAYSSPVCAGEGGGGRGREGGEGELTTRLQDYSNALQYLHVSSECLYHWLAGEYTHLSSCS